MKQEASFTLIFKETHFKRSLNLELPLSSDSQMFILYSLQTNTPALCAAVSSSEKWDNSIPVLDKEFVRVSGGGDVTKSWTETGVSSFYASSS